MVESTASSEGTETARAKRSSDALAFLQKDYELKVRFLADHYGRIWTRFNFFMVATTGLSIPLLQGLRDGKRLADMWAIRR